MIVHTATNFAHGQRAEIAVANHLAGAGFSILARNWRTRYCEIDIIANRAGVVYFVEVKYRRTYKQGSGLDYITPKKLQQMSFAAEMWVHANYWPGSYRLAAAEVVGANYQVQKVIEI